MSTDSLMFRPPGTQIVGVIALWDLSSERFDCEWPTRPQKYSLGPFPRVFRLSGTNSANVRTVWDQTQLHMGPCRLELIRVQLDKLNLVAFKSATK